MRNRFRYCYGETHDGNIVADNNIELIIDSTGDVE